MGPEALDSLECEFLVPSFDGLIAYSPFFGVEQPLHFADLSLQILQLDLLAAGRLL